MNPYKNCPIYENENYLLRLVEMSDAQDLLLVYSDEKAVPYFNSDNCHGDDFHYTTLERMESAIDFWRTAYEQNAFVRWAIIARRSHSAYTPLTSNVHNTDADSASNPAANNGDTADAGSSNNPVANNGDTTDIVSSNTPAANNGDTTDIGSFNTPAANNGTVTVGTAVGTAVGTIELFNRQASDFYHDCGLLRLDLRSDYETADSIREILSLIVPPAFDLFGCKMIATKIPPFAASRKAATEACGFTACEEKLIGGDDKREYGDYYILLK